MAVKGLMGRAGICFVVERKLLPGFKNCESIQNLVLSLSDNDFKETEVINLDSITIYHFDVTWGSFGE